MFGLEENKQFRIGFPKNSEEILPDVVETLLELIRQDTEIEVKLEDFPPDWAWTWNQSKGMFTGKLTKRLTSYLRRRYEYKTVPEQLTQWGNLIRQCEVGREYLFDVDSEVNWKEGDFSDEDSCFFGGSSFDFSHHREWWVDLCGVQAVRFFNLTQPQLGIGRMLAVKLTHTEEECWGFFNAYGLGYFEIARVVSELTGRTYKRIQFRPTVEMAEDHRERTRYDGDVTEIYNNTHSVYLVGGSELATLKESDTLLLNAHEDEGYYETNFNTST